MTTVVETIGGGCKGKARPSIGLAEAGGNDEVPLLSVIVPVFNEAATIAELLRRVLAAPYRKQVIVVDDGSTMEPQRFWKLGRVTLRSSYWRRQESRQGRGDPHGPGECPRAVHDHSGR